jgi:hypothetical protein
LAAIVPAFSSGILGIAVGAINDDADDEAGSEAVARDGLLPVEPVPPAPGVAKCGDDPILEIEAGPLPLRAMSGWKHVWIIFCSSAA